MRRSCACLIFLSQCFIISLIVHYFPATLSFAFICLLTFLPFHLCFHGQFFLCFSVCEWMSFVRYVLGIQLDMECFACLFFFFFFFLCFQMFSCRQIQAGAGPFYKFCFFTVFGEGKDEINILILKIPLSCHILESILCSDFLQDMQRLVNP